MMNDELKDRRGNGNISQIVNLLWKISFSKNQKKSN